MVSIAARGDVRRIIRRRIRQAPHPSVRTGMIPLPWNSLLWNSLLWNRLPGNWLNRAILGALVAPFLMATTSISACPAQPSFPCKADSSPSEDRRPKGRDAIDISVEDEQRFGRMAAAACIAQFSARGIRVQRRGHHVSYLRRLAAKIRPMMRHAEHYTRLNVYLVEAPRCDAWVFPGGHLFFFRGLLDAAESESALVGVIGHELSHLDHGHTLLRLNRIKQARKSFAGTQKRMTQNDLSVMRRTLLHLWNKPMHVDIESQADLDGTRWAYLAGYEPRELARLVLQPKNSHPDQQLPGRSAGSSYPETQQRYRAIMAECDRLEEAQPGILRDTAEKCLRHAVPK